MAGLKERAARERKKALAVQVRSTAQRRTAQHSAAVAQLCHGGLQRWR